MIGPITSSASLYRPAAPAASNETAAPQRSRPPALSSLLTPADWALTSAALGYEVGPSSSGNPHVAPLFALQIAADRRAGVIAPGQPVSVDYLKSLLGPGQDKDFGAQVTSAIDWLQSERPRDRKT